MDLTFVDENDFQKRCKWIFWSDHSSWEISSTISVDTNDSLAYISELHGERESETNSEGDSSWHEDSDVSNQQSDDDHNEEASTYFFMSLPRAPPFSFFTKNLRAKQDCMRTSGKTDFR